MATLEWSPDLVLDIPVMDETHKEFVDLLAGVESAADAQLVPLWQALIEHTVEHFGQEDRWMEATGFAVGNCHASQHKVVLEIMREGAQKAESGDYTMIRGMTPELASWFSYHAQTMDAALAQHMQSLGFDPETGVMTNAQALPEELISGCGGACSQPEDHAKHEAQAEKVAQAAF
ncbi:MAG TPA: hemerythrin domain-containing protein [Comamonas sp.]|uniref:hemerythrin domain-containing protein n=1 Tax=Comamonas halotolerans TaxID=3041496 RepID=UPI0024E0C812|nr:hemerythrin domain-containing protein [Comamonas sp. NoAH]